MADDATWVLTSSFIILTMQSGFGLLEMGSNPAGNEVHILIKNVADVVFGSLAYWLMGYGLSHGQPSNSFMGYGDFAPATDTTDKFQSGYLFSDYIFQFSFAAASTTIVSGCISARTRFSVYCLFSFFVIIPYAICSHWYSKDGWLKIMGVYDFAGGGSVHVFGGMNGLVAIMIIGARTGRFPRQLRRKNEAVENARPMQENYFVPSSSSSQLYGLFMMWWGWIGFNCGSTFGITGEKWVVASRAAIVTINATSGGGICAFLYSLYRNEWKIIKVHHVVNGILGSLVATSPLCSIVSTREAIIIGAIGSLVANMINVIVKRCHLDDPVGSVGVHLGAGVWGLVAVGLFANTKLHGVVHYVMEDGIEKPCMIVYNGLFHGGGFKQLGLQLLAAAVTIGWSILFCALFFYLTGIIISKDWRNPREGLRVSIESEHLGGDECYHGLKKHDQSTPFGRASGGASLRHTANLVQQCPADSDEPPPAANREETCEVDMEN